MRVDIVERLASESADGEAFSDTAVERALKSFLAAVGGEGSLFEVENASVTLSGGAHEKICGGTLALKFRDEKLIRSRGANLSLIQKLSELLKRGESADSQHALLALKASGKAGEQEFVLGLRLEATGNSPEQAALRWGLALAHVQQAVLFASRLLRQQFAQSGD